MNKEEILKYAKVFSQAKGDTYKIHFVNENKTINEPDLWKETLNLIDKLQKENEELEDSREVLSKEILSDKATIVLLKGEIRELKENSISKDKIRKFIKEELPDNEIMNCCEMFDVNGISLRKKLEELLEE